jgi:hypothetical protein
MRNSATEPSQCLLCNEAEYMLCFNSTSRKEGNAGSMMLLIGVSQITDLAAALLIEFIESTRYCGLFAEQPSSLGED